MSSITEKGQMESTSDEGFNSGGQTTNSSPDVSQKKQRRRKQRRRENKKDGTGSNNEITIKIILTNHKKTYFFTKPTFPRLATFLPTKPTSTLTTF